MRDGHRLQDENGLERTFSIKFDANTGNPDDDIVVPSMITDYRMNGLLGNGSLPVIDEPVRDGSEQAR